MTIKYKGRREYNGNLSLHCISEEHQIYVPSSYNDTPFFLKSGTLIWIRNNEGYNVYELTEDISENNISKLFRLLLMAEQRM